MLGGCDNLSESPEFTKVLSGAEAVSRFAQKVVAGRTALAREYTDADLSAEFCANGTTLPNDPDYQRLAQNEFADWRLDVGGLDQRPGSFLLTEIKEIPSRTQITRHDCVEGWSCIGKWEGVRLAALLDLVGLRPTAPLRLRDERQLGYKMAKYIMRIELARVSPGSATETAAIGKIRDMNGRLGFDCPRPSAAQPTLPSDARRSTIPGVAPVCWALSTTMTPLTRTVVRAPVGYWCGSA